MGKRIRQRKFAQRGPLPGCRIAKPHATYLCAQCRNARMRAYRAAGRHVEVYGPENLSRQRLYRAIARGEIERGPCADCAATEGLRAHFAHAEYWRSPTWLCRRCERIRKHAG